MIRLLLTIFVALLANAWHSGRAHAADPAPRINCTAPHQRDLDLTPVGSGPLRLAQVYCQTNRFSQGLKSDAFVSPDGRSIAYLEGTVLRSAPLDGSKPWTDYQMEIGPLQRFSSNIRSIPSFTWTSNSSSLWFVTQERHRPSGFAKAPLRPMMAIEDGSVQELPPIRHDAGPLDGLLWANGDGLALAQFGTRGGYYKPEHDDPKPTFAIVDAKRGIVLDTLAFETIETFKRIPRGASPHASVNNATVTTLPNGKVRALLNVRQWVVWTQGEAPRILTDPYAEEFHNRIVISKDGSSVLVGRMLRTDGGRCGRTGGCSPGTPVEGILAALHDLQTGKLIWSIRATVTNDFEFPTPAISDDGRYALVGLVPPDTRQVIALVSMKDGQIVQTVPIPGGPYSMGFTRNGRIWTHAHELTALYDVRAGAQ